MTNNISDTKATKKWHACYENPYLLKIRNKLKMSLAEAIKSDTRGGPIGIFSPFRPQ